MTNEPEALLVLPHLRIQNANAISSPLTWGFPAASAFTGFAHALQRRMAEEFELEFDGVAIVCHHFEPQVARPSGKRTLVFNLSRNPLDKNGRTAAIVEDGRAHVEVSLVIGVRGAGLHSGDDSQTIADSAFMHANSMRIAGGSVLPMTRPPTRRTAPSLHSWPGSHEERRQLSRTLAMRVLPGFALVSRENLLQQHLETMRARHPAATVLDAWLDLSRLNIDPPRDTANPPKNDWHVRPKRGWLVPIPVGYAAISQLYAPGQVRNARDAQTPFRFVETIFSVGEWISPHRVENFCELLWQHSSDPENGLYHCTTSSYAAR